MSIIQSAKVVRLISKAAAPLAKGMGFPKPVIHQHMSNILFQPIVYEISLRRFNGRGSGNEYDMVIFLLDYGLFRTLMREDEAMTERLFGILMWWKNLGLYDSSRYISYEWLNEIRKANARESK